MNPLGPIGTTAPAFIPPQRAASFTTQGPCAEPSRDTRYAPGTEPGLTRKATDRREPFTSVSAVAVISTFARSGQFSARTAMTAATFLGTGAVELPGTSAAEGFPIERL